MYLICPSRSQNLWSRPSPPIEKPNLGVLVKNPVNTVLIYQFRKSATLWNFGAFPWSWCHEFTKCGNNNDDETVRLDYFSHRPFPYCFKIEISKIIFTVLIYHKNCRKCLYFGYNSALLYDFCVICIHKAVTSRVFRHFQPTFPIWWVKIRLWIIFKILQICSHWRIWVQIIDLNF